MVGFAENGERLVGRLARRQLILAPKKTIYSAKRFIGRRFDEVRGWPSNLRTDPQALQRVSGVDRARCRPPDEPQRRRVPRRIVESRGAPGAEPAGRCTAEGGCWAQSAIAMNTRAPAGTAQTRPLGSPRTRDGHRGAPANRRPRPTHLTGWPVSRPDRLGTPELSSNNRDRRGCTGGHGSHFCDRAVIATVRITNGAAPAVGPTPYRCVPEGQRCQRDDAQLCKSVRRMRMAACRCR